MNRVVVHADKAAGLSWSTRRQGLQLLARGVTARTAAPVAAVVGTLLSTVNQGAVIVGGNANAATWLRVGFNYVVPFCVASFGFLAARRVPAGPDPRVD